MRKSLASLLIAALPLGLLACGSDRIHETDGGGVTLVIEGFDGLPIQVSMNATAAIGLVQVDELVIQNVAKNQNAPTSPLMDVEMRSYEVVFGRADVGTRVPPPLVQGIFGTAPVGGTETYENLPILTGEQLFNAPLSDLLFQNGAFDKETGLQTIRLNLALRFFGRTVSGEDVDTRPANFTIEFIP
jgi:hypothetical protein